MAQYKKHSLKFIRVPNSGTDYLICDSRFRCTHPTRRPNICTYMNENELPFALASAIGQEIQEYVHIRTSTWKCIHCDAVIYTKDKAVVGYAAGSTQRTKLFVVYMKSTWMDGLYKIKEWCIYNSWIRTNNATESMNFVTNRSFGKHPLYRVWLEKLAKQFAAHVSKYIKRAPKERLKNEVLNLEWKRISIDQSASSIVKFLRRCSKAMKVSKDTLV
eukprot:192368_1